jgi:copper(I)-binding protein
VSGPDFASAAASGGFPVAVPANDNVYLGAAGEPSIVLQDLQRSLGSSESIPVTFRFQDAGSVTVQAVVAAEGQTPSPTYDFPDPAKDPSSEG